jgi:hypothetical protein
MPPKNYATRVEAHRTIGEIQALLAKKGARAITITYGGTGEPTGIAFQMHTTAGVFAYRLPCRVEAVQRMLSSKRTVAPVERAQDVAWRTLKDWITAQLAIIEIGMADMHEVMLPYLLADNDQTLYQVWQARNLLTHEDD